MGKMYDIQLGICFLILIKEATYQNQRGFELLQSDKLKDVSGIFFACSVVEKNKFMYT